MNSPYEGLFYISQGFTLTKHDGLDLVGVDSKMIHSTVNGTVHYAGYENNDNKSQGFGLFVCIKDEANGYFYYFGHLSEVKVKTGDKVHITDIIGKEGSTGYSTGSHLHYEIRKTFMKDSPHNVVDVCAFSGIPNKQGSYFDDGYRSGAKVEDGVEKLKHHLKVVYDNAVIFDKDV